MAMSLAVSTAAAGGVARNPNKQKCAMLMCWGESKRFGKRKSCCAALREPSLQLFGKR